MWLEKDINNKNFHDKWYFSTLIILKNKIPVWKNGWYAFVGDNIYVRNQQLQTWINPWSEISRLLEELECRAIAYSVIL